MKQWKLFCVLFTLFFSLNASASLIDNGVYTTDTSSDLDWLDLSETADLIYNDVTTIFPGWRYATNSEVENLFDILFDGFYETNSDGYSSSTENAYSNQFNDILRMESLFGSTYIHPYYYFTNGLYEDERGVLRLMGAVRVHPRYGNNSNIYGMSLNNILESSRYTSSIYLGTYLVRTTTVPLPPSLWLLGASIFGLFISIKTKGL